VEAQLAIYIAPQTDSYTFADRARFPPGGGEPEWTRRAESILPEINFHRLLEPSWSTV
jgi:hypothetical protein